MSVNAIAAIENRMVRVIQNLHSNRVRVEVLPRTMSAAVPGARRRPDGTCGSGYSPLRISVEYMVSPMTRATATWSGTKVLFDIDSESGHKVQIDEAPIFGDDAAMRPTEMLLGALGACTGLNAVLLLKTHLELTPFPASTLSGASLARELRPTFDLRPDRPRLDRRIGDAQLCAWPFQALSAQAGALRVRHHPRHTRRPPAVSPLLPDGDALHHLRRRGRLLLPVGGAAASAQVVRADRDARLHRHPAGRPGPHLEEA